MTDKDGIFPFTVAGREILFKTITSGQVTLLARLRQRLSATPDADKGEMMQHTIVKTLDLIESLIVHDEDREFVEHQMLIGNINYEDLLPALKGETNKPKAAKKTVAKRTPKAAKPVASRARTQR